MPAQYSDEDIARLMSEAKTLPRDYSSRLGVRPKRGHRERELEIRGIAGDEFRLIVRQSDFNPLDFSVILAYCPSETNRLFGLCRYNGKSHEHTNSIEGDSFYDLHIHTATLRYQLKGFDEEAYAQPTDRYADLHGAIRCMLAECGFEIPEGSQGELL